MTGVSSGPPVHLWVYNHPAHGISDQVEFFLLAMREHGLPATVDSSPREHALNIVIENFNETTAKTLKDFCRATGKRVAVVMTEHLDVIEGELRIHGDPLWTANDYMAASTQVERIRNLIDLAPHIRALLCLGDLPELRNLDAALPGTAIRHIPFPKLPRADLAPVPVHDAIFTGVVTAYRASLLTSVRKQLSVVCPMRFVSHAERDRLTRTARIVLNLPQRPGWQWLSLMRVIAALRCGRATVSLGTRDTSVIAQCCEQIDIENPDWLDRVTGLVAEWEALYERCHERYSAAAAAFAATQPFPEDLFEYWAAAEMLQTA
jgi:hypothetical protein